MKINEMMSNVGRFAAKAKYIFNDPATIVLWSDGSKTVVKCGPEDSYDMEKGLAMAIVKKMAGNDNRFHNLTIDENGKLSGAAPYSLTADKITTALGFAPTCIVTSTTEPPGDLSSYPNGTLWITCAESATAASVNEDS